MITMSYQMILLHCNFSTFCMFQCQFVIILIRVESLHIHCHTCVPCCFSTEPNAPPASVTGHNASSTSIFVSWGQVPFLDQNGVILSYTVTYRALPRGSSQTKNVTAPSNQTTVTSLGEYTNYSITVFASTSKGGGNPSTPIVIITDEDSKFVIT